MKYGRLALTTLLLFLSSHQLLAWDLNHGIVKEWNLEGEGLRPYHVAILSDGTAWFTHEEPGGLGKLFKMDLEKGKPYPVLTSFDAYFQTMDRADDDTLWITDYTGKIVHFNPITEEFTPFPLPETGFPPGASPFGVRVAPNGKVWFTCWGDTPYIGVLDPETGEFGPYRIPSVSDGYPAAGTPMQIAFQPHTSEPIVWFTISKLITDRNAGFGRLEPVTGHFAIWTDPCVLFPDLTCPPPIENSLTAPWGIIFESSDPYDFLWFIDKTANLLLKAELRNAPVVTRKNTLTPEHDIEDAHFIARDPDGVFWTAGYFSSSIGTYNETTDTFNSFTLPTGVNPMGIAISPLGEVWWVAAGEDLHTRRVGVGRFIPFYDSDGDGIDDRIDTGPGQLVDFSDGITYGSILDRGDQDLFITEATNPYGVRIIAGGKGGAEPALVNGCSGSELERIELHAHKEAILTCGSASIQAVVGPIVANLSGGIVVTVPSEAKVTITNVAEGNLQIENSGRQEAVTIDYQDQVTDLDPGEYIGGNVDQACPCAGPWKNHGQYVSCVAGTAELYLKAGVITEEVKDAIVSDAAKSSCGKKR